MADLEIYRRHTFGLVAIRAIAFAWAEHAEDAYGMTCTYEEGELEDEVCFTRSGVQGRLVVTHNSLKMNARLGLMFYILRDSIESEIIKKLDDLLENA